MEYLGEPIENPFGAPVLHIAETASTMDDAKDLAAEGASDGTAIYADYQRSGRCRIEGRVWESAAGENLLCTIILRRAAVPGFTLRVGLAASRAFDAFLPEGIHTAIKWPNDVLLCGKKISGILCETSGDVILVGTGFNLGQRSFPSELEPKATSLQLALEGSDLPIPTREAFLARYLSCLRTALAEDDWASAVTARLWKQGKRVSLLAGDPGRNELVDGTVEGIGQSGELLFRVEADGTGGELGAVRRVFSGEFPYNA
jgi:BirA family biotin operon repressor/biotin-[acetyl-CoA-carboxylase] ligase